MFYIYQLKNKINGKLYVGFTGNLQERLTKHRNGNSKLKYLTRAIKKYGWDNFEVNIIFQSINQNKTLKKESYYILKMNTLAPNGYNCTNGGEGTFGYHHTPEAKKKMSNAKRGKKLSPEHIEKIRKRMIGENNPFYGKHHSKESLEKMPLFKVGLVSGENNPFYGKQHSEETIKKLKLTHTGKKQSEETKRKISLALIGNKYASKKEIINAN